VGILDVGNFRAWMKACSMSLSKISEWVRVALLNRFSLCGQVSDQQHVCAGRAGIGGIDYSIVDTPHNRNTRGQVHWRSWCQVQGRIVGELHWVYVLI